MVFVVLILVGVAPIRVRIALASRASIVALISVTMLLLLLPSCSALIALIVAVTPAIGLASSEVATVVALVSSEIRFFFLLHVNRQINYQSAL